MIKEYDRVKVKATGMIGEVLDIHTGRSGKKIYHIEYMERSLDGSYEWIDCYEDEIEKL